MRIQCDACEKATASIMCCADNAALCAECDERVHAPGQLANKHQRVPLNVALGNSPRCDICQEKSAFFFCLDDRALLCRECDFSIHSATVHSSAHQRFLIPGTKVALEALRNDSDLEASEQPSVEDFVRRPLSSIINSPGIINNDYQQQQGMSTALTNSNNTTGHTYAPIHVHSRPTAQVSAQTYAPPPPPIKMANSSAQKSLGVSPASTAYSSVLANVGGGGGGGDGPYGLHGMCNNPTNRTSSIMDFLSEAIPNWRVHELLNTPDLVDGYSLGDVTSFKANVSNHEEAYDWTTDRSLLDELQFYVDKFQEVPQTGSSPPVSNGMVDGRLGRGSCGMHVKGNATQGPIVPHLSEEYLVPDLRLHLAPALPTIAKRQRQMLQV